jgi:hypothetical protein
MAKDEVWRSAFFKQDSGNAIVGSLKDNFLVQKANFQVSNKRSIP